jgi:hypothetical protein
MKDEKKNTYIKVTTPIGRLSYPHLFKTTNGYQDKEKPHYSTEVIFAKNTDLSKLITAQEQAATEMWGPKSKWPDDIAWALKDGDEREGLQGYAGGLYLKAKTGEEYKPAIVDAQKQEILDPSEVYGGVFARLAISMKAYEIAQPKLNGKPQPPRRGVSCYLNAVQKHKDGDKFGGSAVDSFDEIEDYSDVEL